MPIKSKEEITTAIATEDIKKGHVIRIQNNEARMVKEDDLNEIGLISTRVLTREERQAIYNSGKPLTYPFNE